MTHGNKLCTFLIAGLTTLTACAHQESVGTQPTGVNPCAVALAPQRVDGRLPAEITALQERARTSPEPERLVEQLGWYYVAQGRINGDPGFYRLAEQCALCMESTSPRSPEAMLLRGHVLQNLHRFGDAEQLARQLVGMRENAFDYGLLGDTLIDQGHICEAAEAYQRMVDLKPCLQSYSRAAHIRWLKGDLDGAARLMRVATRGASPRASESAAWAYTRLALYELQAGNNQEAERACESALSFNRDYPPALLARGRIFLAQDKPQAAIEPLRRAITVHPFPGALWALADTLRLADHLEESGEIVEQLNQHGTTEDPRTYSLYLSTVREQVDTALRLAGEEIRNRADIFTLDTLAWALAAAGRMKDARRMMNRALQEGTQDARLFLHAGVIAAGVGDEREARQWLKKASEIRQMLLPSEQVKLASELASL